MSRPRFLTKLGLRDRAQVVVFAYESGLVEAGAVALGLLALIATERALVDAERLDSVYRPLSFAMAGGAGTALVVSWARPGPWLLSLLLVAILLVLWFLPSAASSAPMPGARHSPDRARAFRDYR